MTYPRLLLIIAAFLFAVIGVAAAVKNFREGKSAPNQSVQAPEQQIVQPIVAATPTVIQPTVVQPSAVQPVAIQPKSESDTNKKSAKTKIRKFDKTLPHGDRIAEFFNRSEPKFPIVETITYRSRVQWQKGRPAWLSDYATYYTTSRHFISRSLAGKADYFVKDIAEGDRFNVLRKDKNFSFYLMIDASRCKLFFYYVDEDTKERIFIKDYAVGLGRLDSSQGSGMLSPLGKYSLGSRIAIYKPKMVGYHKGKKRELIQVFGTRWIPFDQEIAETTAPSKGFGIHGVPWKPNKNGELEEDLSSLGKYESDGCIRLATKDMEELFAIIITRPVTIEIVKAFDPARLPGKERH